MDTKICASPECHKAGEEQEIDNFYVNYRSSDGRKARCIRCIAKSRSARTKNEGGEWPIPSEKTMMLAINASIFDPHILGDIVNVYIAAGRAGDIR